MTTLTPVQPTARPVSYGLDPSMPRFSVARYQRMIEMGILTSEDPVELLENYVVLKMPRNPLHDSTLQQMLEPLMSCRPRGWSWRVQSAVALSESQPEPDFALVRGSHANYQSRHPQPEEIGLVIEVADTSLLRDQRDKTRIYARAGIPVYWVVNLVDRRIEVYTRPSGPTEVPAYGESCSYQPGEEIPLMLDNTVQGTISVSDLLP